MPSFAMTALVGVFVLNAEPPRDRDDHSYAAPEHVRVKHLDLKLDVDFQRKVLNGEAQLHVERTSTDLKQPLLLDAKGLTIHAVEASSDGKVFTSAPFQLGKDDEILGQALSVALPEKVHSVSVRYTTGPRAAALQWLSPEQTAGKKQPYLFTQSQAIDARSWIPLQDSPGIRITYTATVRVPETVTAVMSASHVSSAKGEFKFEMKQAIPAYLLALAVGDLAFRKIGPRTGVYAEPSVVAKAAAEFSEMEEMVKACEAMYGPYRWERYDVLVMPPSFPFGGMENPRLTFASPTVLAGDKSLVALLAHELAHSWSGNLVTNATWRDFWLNEGFTVYLERRIMEAVYGKARADVEAVLGKRSLVREMAEMSKTDQILHIELKGRRPDDGLTDVPYEKGALFLKHLEAVYGRESLDKFLKSYFAHFAFQSITTAQFEAYLTEHLLKADAARAKKANVKEWLYEPGIPDDSPKPSAEALTQVETHAKALVAGTTPAKNLPAKKWTTQEWLHFLDALPNDLGKARMADLDAAFALTKSGNSEVVFQWLLLSVKHGYEPAYPRLEQFLTEQGRRKFLKPLYEELAKTPTGKERGLAIYRKARATYHPLSADTVDAILGWKETP